MRAKHFHFALFATLLMASAAVAQPPGGPGAGSGPPGGHGGFGGPGNGGGSGVPGIGPGSGGRGGGFGGAGGPGAGPGAGGRGGSIGGPARPGGPGRPPNMNRLATLLDLDTYQKTQVQQVLEEERAAMDASREQLAASGEQPSFEQMHARRDQVHHETLTKLQSVLTQDQIKKFEALTGPPEGPRPPPAPPPTE